MIKAYLTASLFSLLAFSMNPAMAIECYATSPNLVSLGDAYFDLDKPDTLSNEDAIKVNNLFHEMIGKWQGEMLYQECRGPDRAPRISTHHAFIQTEMRLSSTTGLEIVAKKHDVENRVKRNEQVLLMVNIPTFNLVFHANNHLVFAERIRRLNLINQKQKTSKTTSDQTSMKNNKPQTSRITESIYEVLLNNGSLLLTRYYYTNGVYVAEERWQMQPD